MSSPFSRWSLRNRLVLGVVILSTLGFTASGVVAQKQIESFLVHQIDDQLINVGSGALPELTLQGLLMMRNIKSVVAAQSAMTMMKSRKPR